MGPLRFGSSLRNIDAARKCGESQRELYPQVERLRDRCFASEAPDDRLACRSITDIFACVSCAQGGDEGCARARASLESTLR